MKRLSAFRLILILIVLGLVAVSILLGVLAYQDRSEEDKLEDEWKALGLQIGTFAPNHDIGALQEDIYSLEAQLNNVPFPDYVDDNEIFDLVQWSAEIANVTINWVKEGMSTEAIIDGSESEYRVYRYGVTASGAMSAVLTFLSELEENSPYETTKLDGVELTHSGDSVSWSIEFEILVFAQP